jgi:hypothetical protein
MLLERTPVAPLRGDRPRAWHHLSPATSSCEKRDVPSDNLT